MNPQGIPQETSEQQKVKIPIQVVQLDICLLYHQAIGKHTEKLHTMKDQ